MRRTRLRSPGPALALAAAGLWAQTSAPPLLVHLHPLVLDLKGQPVTDLTAGDFKVADQGKFQTIFLFRRPLTKASAELGPHEYTNRPGGLIPHAVAILFDLLNEGDANRLDTWHSLAKSIPQLESAQPVYFYMLGLDGELVPIRPIESQAGASAAWPATFDKDLNQAMEKANVTRPAGLDREDRAKRTYHQLEVVSNQLATLPGRRHLVWITNMMPTITNSLPCDGDWVACGLYVAHMAVTFGHDGTAVNPDYYSGVPQPTTSYDLEQMALLTGGRAYFSQGIGETLRQIARNAANAYEIAYAPSAGNWDNKFHRIRVTVERKGVKMQVQERYYALPDARTAGARQTEILQASSQRPSDSAAIGLRVKVSPSAKGVHLEVRIDAADLLLREQDGKLAAALTLVLSDLGASEAGAGLLLRPIGEPSVTNFNLDLSQERQAAMMIEGVPLSLDHPLGDAVRRVRVMVMDRGTNEVGSVTFPVR